MTQTTVHGTLEYHPMARPEVELVHLRNVATAATTLLSA